MKLYCIKFLMFSLLWNVVSSEEGDTCELNGSGELGICRLVNNCPSATLQGNKKINLNAFKICGWIGKYSMICCPENASKATIECHKINEEVFGTKQSYETSKRVEATGKLIIDETKSEQYEFPHMVAVGYRKNGQIKFNCGGSLISKRFVLTAAHCAINKKMLPAVARVGQINLSKKSEIDSDFNIESIIIHPQYNRGLSYNDIALLRLNKDVEYSTSVYPACLNNNTEEIYTDMIVTGWGNTQPSKNQLLKANVATFNFQDCNNIYTKKRLRKIPRGLSKMQICAVVNYSDNCQSNSGGPLQIRHFPFNNMYTVVGVTSFGVSCGGQIPAVYTRVASYLDWIESRVWN